MSSSSSPLSSSSSSSESGQSRASTPISDFSLQGDVPTPKVILCIPSAQWNSDELNVMFNKHTIGGLLGLYVPRTAKDCQYPVGDQFGWTEESISIGSRRVVYYLGTAPEDMDLTQHELIRSVDPIQASYLKLFSIASLRSVVSVLTDEDQWSLHILEKPAFSFLPLSTTPSFLPLSDKGALVGKGNIPTLEEWHILWSAWDLVTLQMIPRTMLHEKPIDLRHKCLFYIGHIPTFLDMLLSKAIGGGPSEPKHFWDIFERGIDPHVDDPEHCHRHSEVPESDEDWPILESILTFRDNVRSRLTRLYDELGSGKRLLTRNITRTLVMTIEHESFHIETLLYMLIQRTGTGTLPPPGFSTPPWDLLAHHWANLPAPPEPTVILGPETITLGHDDCEYRDLMDEHKLTVHGRTFGWDNESPARAVAVGRFRVEWRPITNREFESFWRKRGDLSLPKSWYLENGEVKVRTIYGPVPMEIAYNWPVLASYDDLALYAQSKGGRLPTEPELRLFLDKYDVGYEGGANVGFRNWHAIPSTMGLEEYNGCGSNGGIWEWTSTLFDAHDGLSPTKLFPGYSTDFFDTKHHVVLGASYATTPRLAGRRTVRNFYQHNYPYAWIGARIVYDI